jgi:hypothetical protein
VCGIKRVGALPVLAENEWGNVALAFCTVALATVHDMAR